MKQKPKYKIEQEITDYNFYFILYKRFFFFFYHEWKRFELERQAIDFVGKYEQMKEQLEISNNVLYYNENGKFWYNQPKDKL